MKAYLEFEVECNSNLCPHLFSSLFLVCHGLSSQCPHPFLYNWDFSNNVLKVFHLLLKLIHVSIYQYYHNFALISHLMLICSLLDSSAQTGAWADEPVRGGGTSASRHKQSSGPAHRLGSPLSCHEEQRNRKLFRGLPPSLSLGGWLDDN